MDQVVQNLPFEIVAVPHAGVLSNTSFAMPIKVKIKMKKGDKSIPQQRVISVPKMGSTRPEITRRVRSDETIMCFDILMEPQEESKPRRKSQNKFFHLFKTGKCLGTQDEDENDPPYMLSTPVKSSEIKSQRLLSGSQDKKQKYNIKTTKDNSKSPDIIFGKCKPGGCLDPPFGEDKYQYYKSVKSNQSKVKNVEDFQKPGKEIPNEIEEKIRNSEVAVKHYNESDASSTYMLYKADPRNEILNDKYSDSIITYPTRTSSRDLSVLEKTIISKQSSSIRNRQVDTYFTPTKISKSQERKTESLNRKNLEKMNSNLPACIIPKSEHTRAILLQNSEIGEENIHSKPLELVIQSNDKLSHVVEISGNMLLTVPQINETIDSLKSKHDEIKMNEGGSEIPLDDYKGITENKTSKKDDYVGSDVSIKNEKKSSNVEISEVSQQLNTLPTINKNTIKTKARQVFNKIDPISNSTEQKNISHMDSSENITTHFIEVEHGKEIDSIIDHSGHEMEDRSLDASHDTIKKELQKHYPYDTNGSTSEMSLHRVQEEKPQLVNLNFLTDTLPNIGNNAEFILETVKNNEQQTKHITNILSNIDDHKSNDDNLSINEDLNVTPTIKLDQVNTSIHSYGSKVYLAEKLALNDLMTPENIMDDNCDSLNQTNNITIVDIELQKLKETNSVTKFETYVDKKSEPKDESSLNSVSSNIQFNPVNKSSDFSMNKHNISSATNNIRPRSENNLLQNNTVITAGNKSDIIDSTKLNQFLEKGRSVSHVNISGNISHEQAFSTLSQDTFPATYFENDVTTATEIDTNLIVVNNNTLNTNSNNHNNNFTKMSETNATNKVDDTNLTENQDIIKVGNKTESVNELAPINLVPQRTDYTILNTSSTTIHKIYIDESKRLEVRKSNQGINETVNNANIPAQETFSKNTLPNLEFQTVKLIGENVSNKSGSIVSAKYLKNENALGISYNHTSEQHLSTGSSKFDVNSIKPTLSAVINNATSNNNDSRLLSNAVSTNKNGPGEIPQTQYIQYFNKSKETTDKEKNEKEDGEWMPFNETKKIKSESLFKTPTGIIVDLGFQTYLNENGETVLKTFDASQEPQRFSQDKIFNKRSALELNELSFTINSDTQLSLKIEKKTSISYERSSKLEEIRNETTQRIYENCKILYDTKDIDKLQESLSAVYENDLIPMEQLIRSLRIEIDRIAQYGQLMRKKSIVATKKIKPTYPKRCVCTRKWNNYG